MDTKHIRIKDYNYDLPDERIAKFPLEERDHSKLLIYGRKDERLETRDESEGAEKRRIEEAHFYNLPEYLPKGELMIFNNTKVIQARLRFRKDTGALIEVFVLEPYSPIDYAENFKAEGRCEWVCMIGNLKKWKNDSMLTLSLTDKDGKELVLHAEKKGAKGASHIIEFTWEGDYSFAEVLDMAGELPIPPYLNRETQESDKKTYQTIYSKIKGSVAAPTAGLHFTDRVLKAIDEAGIEREELTLHVGAGTFKPVKSEEIEGHEMHSEYIVVKREIIEKLISHGGRAIAVGTTSVRTLESLYYIGRKLEKSLDLSEEELHVEQWEAYDVVQGELEQQIGVRNEELGVDRTVHYLNNILRYLDEHNLAALHTSTQIIIAPGYKYHIVRWMVTNFHQPQSTLLLLVSAFIGQEWRSLYQYALDNGFRFLSYGDSMFLTGI